MIPRHLALLLAVVTFLATPAIAQVDLDLDLMPAVDAGPFVAGWDVSADLFAVARNGAAKNAVAVLEYPPSLQLRGVQGLDAPCEVGEGSARCPLGDLSWTESCCRRFLATFSTPVVTQKAELKVTLVSDAQETDLANNTVTASWDLVVFADLHTSVTPRLSRVDPGALVTIKGEVNNWIDTSPRDLRVEFEAADATIEGITAQDRWTCLVEGSKGVCVAAELDGNCRCARGFDVTLRASTDRAGKRPSLVMRASSSLPDPYDGNNAATALVETYRWIPVTTTADAGEGSLRAAIDEVNRTCAADPCKIAFEIAGVPEAGGWFTIAPVAPLPPITAQRVVIDGATQTSTRGNSNPAGPEIVLDGRFTRGANGLDIRSVCEGVVSDLAIGHFDGYAIVAPLDASRCTDSLQRIGLELVARPDRRLITRNYLGTDPTGTAAWPNLRGIAADDAIATISDNLISGNRRSGIWMWRGALEITGNTIGTAIDGKTPLPNGASGIFAGPQTASLAVTRNVIAHHPDMGVAIAGGARQVSVDMNSMFGNAGLAIDRGLDGVTQPSVQPDVEPNAPVLLSAIFDPLAKKTIVTLSLRTTLLQGQVTTISIYQGGRPGDLTAKVGGAYVYNAPSGPANVNGVPFSVEVPGDLRGNWLTATSTRYTFRDIGWDGGATDGTSEPGNSVLVAQ